MLEGGDVIEDNMKYDVAYKVTCAGAIQWVDRGPIKKSTFAKQKANKKLTPREGKELI